MDALDKMYYGYLTNPSLSEYWNSEFFNMGLWNESTKNQREACENLLDHLFATIPSEKSIGSALDVACGTGGIVDAVNKKFGTKNIIGINFSEFQIDVCKKNYPQFEFIHMNADELAFEQEKFDLITCIEAALHFKDRKLFLKNCFELLKPGGHLLMTDILSDWDEKLQGQRVIESRDEYENVCINLGFETVQVTSNKVECWDAFVENVRKQAISLNNPDLKSFYDGCMEYPTTDHIILSATKLN